jgi:hypothetical protein
MDDLREKVIRELEKEVAEGSVPCKPKGYMFPFKLIEDALSLLKTQEPQTVIVDDIPKDDTWFGIWFGRCPNCKEMLTKKYHKHFCGNCGQEVKWSD